MTVRPFKYLLQAVAIEVDDDTGKLVREVYSETVTVYDAEQAAKAITEIEEQIAAAGVETAAGETNGVATERSTAHG